MHRLLDKDLARFDKKQTGTVVGMTSRLGAGPEPFSTLTFSYSGGHNEPNSS